MIKHWARKPEHDDMPRGSVVPGSLFRVLGELPIWEPGKTGLGTPERLKARERLVIIDSRDYFGVTIICTRGVVSCYLNHIQECCVEV